MGEGAISGSDVGYLDKHGEFALPGAEPVLWLPIGGLILFQAVLIFTLIRLRERPNRRETSILHADRLA
jgi:hypothetical protein